MPGFLPFRGSLMLDAVCVAMVLITVVLSASIYLVRYHNKQRLHRNIQLALAALLAIAVTAFEVDMRFFTDWRALAKESVFYPSGWVDRALWIHLIFAVPTPFIWLVLIVSAVRRFGATPADPSYWKKHRVFGRVAAAMMFATALTGWVFYGLAFVA